MAVYNLLAAAFLFGTIIMVAGTFFMGYLHWKEERRQPLPVRPTKKVVSGLPSGNGSSGNVSIPLTPPAANDPSAIKKAS